MNGPNQLFWGKKMKLKAENGDKGVRLTKNFWNQQRTMNKFLKKIKDDE